MTTSFQEKAQLEHNSAKGGAIMNKWNEMTDIDNLFLQFNCEDRIHAESNRLVLDSWLQLLTDRRYFDKKKQMGKGP